MFDYNRYKYICFQCRTVDKCHKGHPLTKVGCKFRAPKKNNKKAWKDVEHLLKAGITFFSDGCVCCSDYKPSNYEYISTCFHTPRYYKQIAQSDSVYRVYLATDGKYYAEPFYDSESVIAVQDLNVLKGEKSLLEKELSLRREKQR